MSNVVASFLSELVSSDYEEQFYVVFLENAGQYPFHAICIVSLKPVFVLFYTSGFQTCSSRYPNQSRGYVLLSSIFCVVKRTQPITCVFIVLIMFQ